LYKYKLDKEITALTDPMAYLRAKRTAVNAVIDLAAIRAEIGAKAFRVGG